MKTVSLTSSLRLLLCLISLVAPVSFLHATVTNLLWYRLGENDPGAALGVASTNTVDLIVGRSLPGFGGPVYTNAVSTIASNNFGSSLAVQFSGANQYFSNATIVALTNNFSIEAWVNPNTVSTGARIIAYNGNAASDGWGIYQSGTNYFGIFGGSVIQIGATSGAATAGTWTHVALVREGGTAALFINGVINGTTTTASPMSPHIGDGFAVGALPEAPSSDDFNGTIDEVRICDFGSTQFRTSDLLVNLQRATTLPGAALSTFSATLNGTAGTANLPTSAWFEWGTTTNYGNTTQVQSISRIIASANFSDTISNLVVGVTYQFHAVVSNSLGVAYGANESIPILPLQVTNTADNGPGSLRDTVNNAVPGDAITFAPGLTGTITLTNGPIVIGQSLSIAGPGPKLMFLTSAGAGSALDVTGGDVQISGLTVTDSGGGIDNGAAISNSANLTLSNCEMVVNSLGPALMQSSNNLVLLNSSFINNSQGGIVIATNSTASATNCTFFNNSSSSGGAVNSQGQLNLISCTLVFNNAGGTGGGVYSTGTATVGNCIIANNAGISGGVYGEQDLAGNYLSLGYNFIGAVDGSTGFTNGVNSDHVGTSAAPINPQLTGTGYNGGQTHNFVPAFNSPVIDAGYSFGTATDQRGFVRPLDFWQIPNAAGGDGSDIGAIEYGASFPCSECVTQVTVDASQTLRPADGRWFGANTATWESMFDTPDGMSLLNEMGVTTLRYPGGGLCDAYHWASNYWFGGTPNFGPAAFGNFMHVATNLAGANVFISVNYGTGTSNEAADWVRSANVTNHCGFKYWEVGNENYFVVEADSNTVPPYQAHDPWTYATRFCGYYAAMKAVDPTIKVGAVVTPGEDVYNSSPVRILNPRTGLYHSGWVPVLLGTMKSNGVTPDFLIHHFYPETGVDSDPELLQAPVNWAADAAELRQEITDYVGDAGTNIELVCTENNSDSDYHLGKQSTSLVNGVYLADSLGQLMKTEFNSYLWWIFESGKSTSGSFSPSLYGWRTYGDFGLALNVSTKYPTFYAMKLMHDFVQPGDTILDTGPGYPFLDVFAATKTNGTLSVLFINKDRSNTFSRQITLTNFSLNAAATVRSYGMPQDNATKTNGPLLLQDIATNQMTVAGGGFTYTFPPYSMTLFTLAPTSPMLTVFPTASNSLVVSWPYPSAGWILLQNTDLATTNWTAPPETIQNDGTNNFIIIAPPIGNRFFELLQP
jgi:hypothetical protein